MKIIKNIQIDDMGEFETCSPNAMWSIKGSFEFEDKEEMIAWIEELRKTFEMICVSKPEISWEE